MKMDLLARPTSLLGFWPVPGIHEPDGVGGGGRHGTV